MNKLSEMDYMVNLVSRDTLNTMSGKQKLAFKYCLCAIFINIIIGAHYTRSQEINISKAEDIRKLPRKLTDFEGLIENISVIVNRSLERYYFKKPYDVIFLDNIIAFLRNSLKDLQQNQVSLFQAKEISTFIDIKKFFCPSISNHHWIEFGLMRHLIITVPELIIFNDLKVQWNYYVEIRDALKKEQESISSRKAEFEFFKMKETREKIYKLSALYRMLIILCVSFVEAYLYDVFYCIRESDMINKDKIKDVLYKKKIEDNQIIKQVIYPLFPHIKDDIDNFFEEYKKTIKYRDRYIHASSFIDQSTNISELEPLVNFHEEQLIQSLQTSVNLIKKLDELLPEQLKLLFWWYDDEIKFDEFNKLKLTNEKSQINRNIYYNI